MLKHDERIYIKFEKCVKITSKCCKSSVTSRAPAQSADATSCRTEKYNLNQQNFNLKQHPKIFYPIFT